MSTKRGGEPKGPYILIVDDEPLLRAMLTRYLGSLGYFTLEAGDGLECMAKIEKRTPDAILLDILMPKMDGIEVVTALKEQGREIPILLMSVLAEFGPNLFGDETLNDHFIKKPFDLTQLAKSLEAILTERKESSGLAIDVPREQK